MAKPGQLETEIDWKPQWSEKGGSSISEVCTWQEKIVTQRVPGKAEVCPWITELAGGGEGWNNG